MSTTVTLSEASNDTLALVKAATSSVRRTWRSGFLYCKAGVITVHLAALADSQRRCRAWCGSTARRARR